MRTKLYERKKFEETLAGQNIENIVKRKTRNNLLLQLNQTVKNMPRDRSVMRFNIEDERNWLKASIIN